MQRMEATKVYKKRESQLPASTFFIIQFQWLKQSVVSPLPLRQKAPLRQGFQPKNGSNKGL
jgi:hypothetical protein